MTNVRAVLPDKIIENATIVVKNGLIDCIEEGPCKRVDCIDGKGMYLLAGFIDIHCHGGTNYDFMDASPEEMGRIAYHHLAHGTTTLVPTTMTDNWDAIEGALTRLQAFYQIDGMGVLQGAHLEGPWLSPSQCGAQDSDKMDLPSLARMEKLLKTYPFITRISVAPELNGGMQIGQEGQRRGVVMSIAHTEADFDKTMEAADMGYSLVTHLYSGMSGVVRKNAYRIAGAVEAALYNDRLFVEIIADGKHLPISLLKLIVKCKGADKICLITDAMRASGLQDGEESVLGRKEEGVPVIVEDGVAKLLDRQSFAGSIATTDRLICVMRSAGVDLVSISKMASATPAKVMGMTDRGSIEVGKRADFVWLNEELLPQWVMLNGELRYKKVEGVL